jgi:hypothetical protein
MEKPQEAGKVRRRRLTEVLKGEALGLTGALWIWVASQDPPSRPAFMVFGIAAVGLSLANLWMLGEWEFRKSSG